LKVRRVGIVGGGPAGLSLARLLEDSGRFETIVFEAAPTVGGKSFSFISGETVVEMGTCYTTRAHRQVLKWMKDTDIALRPLGEQAFDKEDFLEFVKRGSGAPLSIQVLGFLRARRKLVRALAQRPMPDWAIEEAATPISDWLAARNLPKIERFMLRSMTSLGYGFVSDTPTVQALRWNDIDLILTGLLEQLKMPVKGWTEFWVRLAETLDVRTEARIVSVQRQSDGVEITTEHGESEHVDEIVCAIPLDEFARTTTPTAHEVSVSQAIRWNGYTTTLVAVEGWFQGVQVEGYSEATMPGAGYGRMLSARLDGYEKDLGGNLYLTGQLTGEYTASELQEILREDITRQGGRVRNIILQKQWKYFAQYNNDAVRNGLLMELEDMQGDHRTWYTGATFSHEAVSNIVNFNADLVRRMRAIR